mgnify:CR=1 FL=1
MHKKENYIQSGAFDIECQKVKFCKMWNFMKQYIYFSLVLIIASKVYIKHQEIYWSLCHHFQNV